MYEGGAIHSDTALNVPRLFSQPALLKSMCEDLLSSLPQPAFRDIGLVVTHLPYGADIARCFSELISCSYVVFDGQALVDPTPLITLGQKKCLVVTDDILTGGRMRALLSFLEAAQISTCESVIALADFASFNCLPTKQVVSCIREPIALWKAEECMLCAHGSIPRRRIDL
jgi:hypothetical protein